LIKYIIGLPATVGSFSVLSQMSKWFSANKLSLKHDKINIIKFVTNNSPQYTLSTGYKEKYVEESVNKKFLGLHIDNCLNWKNYIHQLVSKLSGACYALRSVSHISNTDTLKSICFAYFHFRMKYGITFWGNSCYSRKIFTLQKKIIRIMAGVKPRDSCRSFLKRLEILNLSCKYIFSLMNFTVNKQRTFSD
jgi:hypothetical protein